MEVVMGTEDHPSASLRSDLVPANTGALAAFFTESLMLDDDSQAQNAQLSHDPPIPFPALPLLLELPFWSAGARNRRMRGEEGVPKDEASGGGTDGVQGRDEAFRESARGHVRWDLEPEGGSL